MVKARGYSAAGCPFPMWEIPTITCLASGNGGYRKLGMVNSAMPNASRFRTPSILRRRDRTTCITGRAIQYLIKDERLSPY